MIIFTLTLIWVLLKISRSYLALNTEYGANRNSITPSNSVFRTNFTCLHRNSLFVWPRWSSYKTNQIGKESSEMQSLSSVVNTVCQGPYQYRNTNTTEYGDFFVATTYESHRCCYIQWCGEEDRNTITLLNLEKVLTRISESTTSPCATISCVMRKRFLEMEMDPLKDFPQHLGVSMMCAWL